MARAELYEYTDGGGHKHYVESLQKVPEQYRDGVNVIRGERLTISPPQRKTLVGADAVSPASGRFSLPADDAGHTQAYWCRQKKKLEDRIADLQAQKNDLESLGAVDLTQPAGVKALHDIQQDLDRVKGELAEAQAALAALPNEIRKAGGNPGWVRGSLCPTSGPSQVGARQEPPPEKKGPEPNSKQWWQAKKKDLADRKARLEEEIADLESGRIEAGEQYDPVVAARTKSADERLVDLKRELTTVTAELADLPNQARKAGVPAGWVR